MHKLRSSSGSTRIGFLLVGATAFGTLALATGLVAPGIASARSARHPSAASITVSPYTVSVGDSVSVRGVLPCAAEGTTGTVTDAAGAVTGTAITFKNGGAFHADVPVGTPSALTGAPPAAPLSGVDTLAIGSPTCGLAAPIDIASATVVTPLAPSVLPTGAVTGTATGTARQNPGSPGVSVQAPGIAHPSSTSGDAGTSGGRTHSGEQSGGHDSARHQH